MKMLLATDGTLINPGHITAIKKCVSKKYKTDVAEWERKEELLFEYRNYPDALENIQQLWGEVKRPSFVCYFATKVTTVDGTKHEIAMDVEDVQVIIERSCG